MTLQEFIKELGITRENPGAYFTSIQTICVLTNDDMYARNIPPCCYDHYMNHEISKIEHHISLDRGEWFRRCAGYYVITLYPEKKS